MNDLIEIYRRIEYLRNNGLKMKEIADYVDIAPSVLSALYSSVLPTYVTSLKQGHSEEFGKYQRVAFQFGTCPW